MDISAKLNGTEQRGAGIGTHLTPAGQALAESAPQVFRMVDQARTHRST